MKKTNQFLTRETILFLVGGLIYVGMELFWRGFSHWSMFIVGGLCFVIIGLLNEWYNKDMNFFLQMGIGCFVITALELISGYIVNIKLGWNVWDYSDRMFNLGGQICLGNTILWFFLSAVAIVMDDIIRWVWFHEDPPHYKFLR